MRIPWSCRPMRVACLLAGLLISGATYGQGPATHTAGQVGAVPDSHGAIAEILLHYDPNVTEELEPVYRDLFGTLPEDVRLKILCPTAEAAEDFIFAWELALDNRSVDVINVGLPLTVWARDRCIARQSKDLRHAAETFVPVAPSDYEEEKNNDLLLQDVLHEARLAPAVMDSPLHLEGGNVVSNRRHAFLGTNVLLDNDEMTRARLQNELQRILGRTPMRVGDPSGDVPWCHVDMYLTPIGDDTVLVASPRLATHLLSACETGEENEGWPETLSATTCPSDSLQDQFDQVAEQLRKQGYRVYRLPAIANVPEQWMVTYNNVILDERQGCRVVYMPIYGVPALDRAASRTYRRLGFEVNTVDVSRLFESGGALRCIANVTARWDAGNASRPGASDGRLRLINLAETLAFDGILDRCRHRLARRGLRHAWGSMATP